jgi:hypothetical protein
MVCYALARTRVATWSFHSENKTGRMKIACLITSSAPLRSSKSRVHGIGIMQQERLILLDMISNPAPPHHPALDRYMLLTDSNDVVWIQDWSRRATFWLGVLCVVLVQLIFMVLRYWYRVTLCSSGDHGSNNNIIIVTASALTTVADQPTASTRTGPPPGPHPPEAKIPLDVAATATLATANESEHGLNSDDQDDSLTQRGTTKAAPLYAARALKNSRASLSTANTPSPKLLEAKGTSAAASCDVPVLPTRPQVADTDITTLASNSTSAAAFARTGVTIAHTDMGTRPTAATPKKHYHDAECCDKAIDDKKQNDEDLVLNQDLKDRLAVDFDSTKDDDAGMKDAAAVAPAEKEKNDPAEKEDEKEKQGAERKPEKDNKDAAKEPEKEKKEKALAAVPTFALEATSPSADTFSDAVTASAISGTWRSMPTATLSTNTVTLHGANKKSHDDDDDVGDDYAHSLSSLGQKRKRQQSQQRNKKAGMWG